MGPRVLLSGPNASGLEAQVLGAYSNETFPQAGREAIQVARAADVQGPLWNQWEFHRRVEFRRYYNLVFEDLQIRRVTMFPLFSIKEMGRVKENGGLLPGRCSRTSLISIP